MSLYRSKLVRFLLLVYCVFSVFLTINHSWHWLRSGPVLDSRFGENWVAQRTYNQDDTYSVVDGMSHGLKMAKLLSKSYYEAAEAVEPYWLKASKVPFEEDVSIITTVTPGTWTELVRLVEHWQGPVSATLQVKDDKDGLQEMSKIRAAYNENPKLATRLDIHLSRHGGRQPSVLLSRNAERNLARLFARTEFIVEMPNSMVPGTNLRKTLEANQATFVKVLREGDVLVVPTFGFPRYDKESYTVPHHKARLLELVEEEEMIMIDKHWKTNQGPTNMTHWKDADILYLVEKYEFHYEPVVIESKTVQPWCAERFLDSRSACRFSSYLTGAKFWVLPDDFVVQLPENKDSVLTDFDNVIESRLYAKFYWEKCVHYARQLDALGLWRGSRSQHIRTQCSLADPHSADVYRDHPMLATQPKTSCEPIGYDEREDRIYELIVCQQPLHARMCGFGEKDRRPIDPPPIVQLVVQQGGSRGPVDVQTLQAPFFVLHVTLWSDDRKEERNIISNPPKCTRVLMGSLVSSPSLLKNTEGEQGLYFAFPDLSIRTEGRYTLRFSLMKLVSSDFQTNAKSKIIAQVFSDPFTVYSAKKNLLNYQRHSLNKASKYPFEMMVSYYI
ncbi:velvet factor-domain-containing protein [Phycomyces blakesleeanus]|uniref:Velvet factor-domain-containing protein n=1 Tax=Phycomyces blakesleeanus TaxID=4837 RepID=A0ABR3BIW8_PHYBL